MQHVCRLQLKAEISGCKCYLFFAHLFIYLFIFRGMNRKLWLFNFSDLRGLNR